MIVDRIDQGHFWSQLNPGFAAAFAFLKSAYEAGVEPGKHVLVPERLWVVVERGAGRSNRAPLEAHLRFIDIQLVLEGNERIGWRPLADCRQPREPYNAERDIEFYNDPPTTWIDLVPGQFAVFFPRDAHAPLAGSGEVLKAVAKIAVAP